jgi:hypothetical protein
MHPLFLVVETPVNEAVAVKITQTYSSVDELFEAIKQKIDPLAENVFIVRWYGVNEARAAAVEKELDSKNGTKSVVVGNSVSVDEIYRAHLTAFTHQHYSIVVEKPIRS